jgi:6-phosphogluconate dehydrogenase
MQLGMIGLGRMGSNMVRRLTAAGHECVVNDVDPAAVAATAKETGATGADSLEVLADRLSAPRAVWIMVPAAYVGGVVERLAGVLDAGDTIIDGATRGTTTTSTAPEHSNRPGSTTSTSARAEGFTGSSAVTA